MNVPIITFAVALVCGILCSHKGLPLPTALIFPALGGVAAVLARRSWAPAAAVALAGVTVGAWLGHRHYHEFAPDHVRELVGEERRAAVVEGVISDDPAFRSYQYLRWAALRIEAEAITLGGARRPARGTVACYVWADELPAARYGQRVRISGQLARPDGPANPGEVDRRLGYAHDRIYAVLSAGKTSTFEVLDERAGNPLLAAAFALKARLRAALRAAVPGEAGAFLDSILLGTRENLDPPVLDGFVKTGTVHVLAVSGQHLSLIAVLLYAVLVHALRLPVRAAIVIVLGFAIGYCAITGASPSILRATIMVALVSIGRLISREAHTLNSLAVAAALILAWNPGDLMNAGFQLSFAAILGLELFYVPLKAAYVARFPPLGARASRPRRAAFFSAWLAGDAVLASTAAWVATAPLVLCHFHLVTPGAILVNVAILLPVWVVLNAGMLVLALAPLSATLAAPVAAVAAQASGALVGIVEACAAVPGVYAYVADVGSGRIAASYVALGGSALALARRARPRWALPATLAAAAIALVPFGPAPLPPGEARLGVLAVGKGLTTVVRTGEGTVLFDCGAGKIIDPGSRFVAPYLWHEGVRRVDAIFLSHAHDDHLNAVLALADRFSLGRVFVGSAFEEAPGGAHLLEALRARGVPVEKVGAGDRIAPIGGLEVEVLAPVPPPPSPGDLARASGIGAGGPGGTGAEGRPLSGKDDQNDRSLVLRATVGGHRILLPGDLEEPGSEALLGARPEADLGADVLLIPHHGSANRFTEALAARVRPRIAIASTKERFASAGILCAYEDAGSAVVETWATGCIEMTLAPGRLDVRAFAGGLPEVPADRQLACVPPPEPPAAARAPPPDLAASSPAGPPGTPGASAPPGDLAGTATDEGRPPDARAGRAAARRGSLGTDEEARGRPTPARIDRAALARVGDEIAVATAHARAAVRAARSATSGWRERR